MNVLIIEDEELAVQNLELKLRQIDNNINIVGKTGSIKESISWLRNNSADLIFLDIQLSDGLSFSIFEEIQVNTPIIFTTAYDQYAIKAFDLNSISYLLKPIRKKDLEESIKKYKSLKNAFNLDIETLISNYHGEKPNYKKRFLIKIGDKLNKLEVNNIAYLYAMEKSVFAVTFENKTLPMDYSLDLIEDMLNPELFFRVNRKYIVNTNSIKNMIAWSRSRVKLDLHPSSPDEVVVSVERASDFKKWLDS